MKTMKKNVFMLAMLAVILSLAACKGTRALESGEQATSLRHLLKLIQQNEPSFTTMNASNIAITANMGEKSMNISASLKIKTDSIVQLAIIPFMGIEMYSLELYPDRWMLYDKINRVYYTDNYEYFYYKWGVKVDFNSLQSLFSARFFSAGEREPNLKKLQYVPLESGKNKIENNSGYLKQSVSTYASHMIEEITLTNREDLLKLTATYKDYMLSRGVNYPRNIIIKLSDSGNPLAGLDMKIRKISFNSDLKLSTANPERYKRSTLDQLLK